MKWSNIKELLMHILFFLTACVSIFAVVLICVFLFANGIPAIGKIGVFKFLLGTKWKPGNDIYGILPMILGSLYVGGRNHHRCADWTSDGGFSCKVLPEGSL